MINTAKYIVILEGKTRSMTDVTSLRRNLKTELFTAAYPT